MRPISRDNRAFSLIEVNLALLVVGIGLVALLSLFPVGLRESSMASADTTEAIFATRALNAIQANANNIRTWADWQKDSSFIAGISIDGKPLKAEGTQVLNGYNGIPKSVVRYALRLGVVDGTGGRLRYAAIRVSDNKYAQINNNTVYYTEFRYRSF